MSATDRLQETVEQPPELPFSEDDLASRFSAEHADDLRYVARWGRWFKWDGCCWREDETVHVFDLVRAHNRKIAATCNEGGKGLVRATTVASIERMAKSDRRHALTTCAWDVDEWLLNTPGGTFDLRTGGVRPHNSRDYITKLTSVAPGGTCPTWHGFLERVTGGDDELQIFLQRVVGYALTGNTREHVLLFLYGTGANGKSVFVNTIAGVLGDYHTAASMDVFLESRNDRHPTELAGLRGARLVTAVETEAGRRWAESRIRALTGGDRISARFMRQDFFEFTPQFKLLVAGNYKPSLRSVDEAIRRRLHLIPFTVTIPPDERDQTLADKLKAEWPGVLAWAIDGAVAWHTGGLRPPQAVQDATQSYLAEEDRIGRWIADRCHVDPEARVLISKLYKSFCDWCEEAGERPGNRRVFSDALESHRYYSTRVAAGVQVKGLRL